jgi:hypothetical protein
VVTSIMTPPFNISAKPTFRRKPLLPFFSDILLLPRVIGLRRTHEGSGRWSVVQNPVNTSIVTT